MPRKGRGCAVERAHTKSLSWGPMILPIPAHSPVGKNLRGGFQQNTHQLSGWIFAFLICWCIIKISVGLRGSYSLVCFYRFTFILGLSSFNGVFVICSRPHLSLGFAGINGINWISVFYFSRLEWFKLCILWLGRRGKNYLLSSALGWGRYRLTIG